LVDIGFGPRGSLSFIWDEVGQFLGLDPLAKSYGPLGASEQPMVYIHSPIEDMPFPDASIDVVTSINSFDHVVNPSRGLGEVFRVLRPGGSFLLIVEMKAKATVCEPVLIRSAIVEDMKQLGFNILQANYHSYTAQVAGTGTVVLSPKLELQNKPGWLGVHAEKSAN